MLKYVFLFVAATCFLSASDDLEVIRSSVQTYCTLKKDEYILSASKYGHENPELRFLQGKIDASQDILSMINIIDQNSRFIKSAKTIQPLQP